MSKNLFKQYIFFICILLFSAACGEKNISDSKVNINNQPFWLKPFPKMSPYDVVDEVKRGNIYLNCPTDFTIGYSNTASNFVKIDKYVWMEKEFKVNFYFWNEKNSSVLLSSLKEVSYEESLKIAERFISLFTKIKGEKPKIENRFDSNTKETLYTWEDSKHTIKIIISSIVSETAIFNISFTDKTFSPNSQAKYQKKYDYLKNCRKSIKKTPVHNDKDSFLVPPPPKSLPHN